MIHANHFITISNILEFSNLHKDKLRRHFSLSATYAVCFPYRYLIDFPIDDHGKKDIHFSR